MSTLYSSAVTCFAVLWEGPLRRFYMYMEKVSPSPQEEGPNRERYKGVRVVQVLLSLLFLISFAHSLSGPNPESLLRGNVFSLARKDN